MQVKFSVRHQNEQRVYWRQLLVGTSPEFELAAFTVCALAPQQTPSERLPNVVTVKVFDFALAQNIIMLLIYLQVA